MLREADMKCWGMGSALWVEITASKIPLKKQLDWRRKQSSANPSRLAVSLVSGKITGNLLDSGADPVSDSQIVPMYRAPPGQIPYETYQGILGSQSG